HVNNRRTRRGTNVRRSSPPCLADRFESQEVLGTLATSGSSGLCAFFGCQTPFQQEFTAMSWKNLFTRRPHTKNRRTRPRLEALEDRTMPAPFLVSNLNDSGVGSLRQAVLDANAAAPGPNEIDFAAGLHGTITLTSGELLLTRSVTINGPGANKLSV